MKEYYDYVDARINAALNADVGFGNLLAAAPHALEPAVVRGFSDRYGLISEYQRATLALFSASLRGEADPEIARLVINELPEQQGMSYHRSLAPGLLTAPVFFRTDEVAPGVISEIQCPGSAWGIYEQAHDFCRRFEDRLGGLTNFPGSLAQSFAAALNRCLPTEPVVHHLLDNSSLPHKERYFIHRLREHGVRFYSFDRDIMPRDCNFIRAHDFHGLFYENFAAERRESCAAGRLYYDLPPIALFETKVHMVFPFWDRTRSHYSDAVRNMFPYAALIRPEGVVLEDGGKMSLADFAALPPSARGYYIKYAGSDVALNWGSRGVYAARTFSSVKLAELLDSVASGFSRGRFWILQREHQEKSTARYFTRDGEEASVDAYSKYSGLYGPEGLMGILVMQRPFFKVHGGNDTIVGVCR